MSRRGIKHIGLSANNPERKEMTAPAVISFYKPMPWVARAGASLWLKRRTLEKKIVYAWPRSSGAGS